MIGDYILQTDSMAVHKTSSWKHALLHGFTYTLPFLFLTHSLAALLVIALTHAVIDRYRLAKYLVWAKNQLAPKADRPPKSAMKTTGYRDTAPDWMAVWLLILADNTVHLVINALALVFLGQVWVLF